MQPGRGAWGCLGASGAMVVPTCTLWLSGLLLPGCQDPHEVQDTLDEVQSKCSQHGDVSCTLLEMLDVRPGEQGTWPVVQVAFNHSAAAQAAREALVRQTFDGHLITAVFGTRQRVRHGSRKLSSEVTC